MLFAGFVAVMMVLVEKIFGIDPAHDGPQNIVGDSESNSTVVFAQVLFRTGLHAVEPENLFNTNYLDEDVTDLRLMGDLTKKGKMQECNVGKYLRNRYSNLLNSSYNQYKVRMFSGPKNRSMSSAALVLAGLFPPEADYEIWNQHLHWQPVPVHINTLISERGGSDMVMSGTCNSLKWIMTSDACITLQKHYDWIITFLCEKAHKEKSLINAGSVAAVLVRLSFYPGSQPKWANKTVMDTAQDFYWDTLAMINSFHSVIRLSAGWFLEDIVNEMKYFMARKTNRKFVAYSVHVDNMDTLIVSLNNQSAPVRWPLFGSFMSFELHYINTQYIVKAFYWYSIESREPNEIEIIDCENPCTLERFEQWTKNFHVENWYAECNSFYSTSGDTFSHQSITDNKDDSLNGMLLFCCLTLAVLFCCTLICLMLLKRKHRRFLSNGHIDSE